MYREAEARSLADFSEHRDTYLALMREHQCRLLQQADQQKKQAIEVKA